MLDAKGVGARRLDLLFHRVDSALQAIRIGTAKPDRDPKRLTRLLCDKFETIDPGFGVEAMSLCATLAEPFETKQIRTSLLDETPDTDVSGLIDILTNRVGAAKLYRFAPVESDVPERSVRRIAPAAAATKQGWPDALPRPVRLLRKPERIETVALLPDHPPVSFTWRGVRRRVRRADGPERIFGEWWKRDAECDSVRDYFQVEDEQGERFWIFRAGDGEDPETGSQSLVPAWDFRMTGQPNRAALCRAAGHLAFLFPARRQLLRGAVRAGGASRHRGAGDHRPQFSLAGIVRAHEAAKATGVRLIVGCRLDLTDGISLLVYPTDRPAYARLCRLLSLGQEARRQGAMPSRLVRCRRLWRRLIAVLLPDAADEHCALPAAPLERDFWRPRLYGADLAAPAERSAAAA